MLRRLLPLPLIPLLSRALAPAPLLPAAVAPARPTLSALLADLEAEAFADREAAVRALVVLGPRARHVLPELVRFALRLDGNPRKQRDRRARLAAEAVWAIDPDG